MIQIGDKLYRYNDMYEEDGDVRPHLTEYTVDKLTPCGCWVNHKIGYFVMGKPHFILNTSNKKFAYPTKDEALKSYLYRKIKQVAILTHQLAKAQSLKQQTEVMLGIVQPIQHPFTTI